MQHQLLYEYLQSSKALTKVQDFLKDFCGLDMELLDKEGKPLALSVASTSSSVNFFSSKTIFSEQSPIPNHILSETIEFGEPRAFRTEDHFLKILVPVVYDGSTVAFLYTGEQGVFRFQKTQLNSILNYLKGTVKVIVEEDFKTLRGYEGNQLTHKKKLLHRVINFISENYNLPDLTLNEVSKQNNISYFYLSHLFNRELKTSFSSFLTNLRMDVASRLLKDKSLTVNQISFSCGFVDAGYFSKVFKKVHGRSPAEYRSGIASRRKMLGRSRRSPKLKRTRFSALHTQESLFASSSK